MGRRERGKEGEREGGGEERRGREGRRERENEGEKGGERVGSSVFMTNTYMYATSNQQRNVYNSLVFPPATGRRRNPVHLWRKSDTS